jgi:hypothetical protein
MGFRDSGAAAHTQAACWTSFWGAGKRRGRAVGGSWAGCCGVGAARVRRQGLGTMGAAGLDHAHWLQGTSHAASATPRCRDMRLRRAEAPNPILCPAPASPGQPPQRPGQPARRWIAACAALAAQRADSRQQGSNTCDGRLSGQQDSSLAKPGLEVDVLFSTIPVSTYHCINCIH